MKKSKIFLTLIISIYLCGQVYSEHLHLAPPSPFEKEKIVVVCTGDTCRSPLAAALLRKYLPEKALAHLEIVSAGTHASDGSHASEGSIRIAAEEQIYLSQHRSQQLTQELIGSASIIFVMTRSQKEYVAQFTSNERVILFAGDSEINDPFSGEITYEEALQSMKDSIPGIQLLLSERFPHLRQILDPEWSKWQKAVSMVNSKKEKTYEKFSEVEEGLNLLTHKWQNPERRNHAINLLVNALTFEGRLSDTASKCLVKIGKDAVPNILSVLFSKDSNDSHSYTLLDTLAEIKDPQSIDPLVDLLKKPSLVKRPIALTLLKIGHPHAVDSVLNLIIEQNKRDNVTLGVLRLIGSLNLKSVFAAWKNADSELKPLLLDVILEISNETAIAALIITIRDCEEKDKTGFKQKLESNHIWKNQLDQKTRNLLEQLAYYLFKTDKLHIFPDIIAQILDTTESNPEGISALISKCGETSSLAPLLKALALQKYKGDAKLIAIILDTLAYYPDNYIADFLGEETESFLGKLGLLDYHFTYQELISSRLFWHRKDPDKLRKVFNDIEAVKIKLGSSLFEWLLKEIGFTAIANKLILNEAIEINFGPNLTFQVHPSLAQPILDSVPEAGRGRRLFALGSYKKTARNVFNKKRALFNKFKQYNFDARKSIQSLDVIDRVSINRIERKTAALLESYIELYPDDPLLKRIREVWSAIEKTSRDLVKTHKSIPKDSILRLEFTRISHKGDIDSVSTIHDFINFIHQRGLDRRFNLTGFHKSPDDLSGELSTIVFSDNRKILSKRTHRLILFDNEEDKELYDIPSEIMRLLENLLSVFLVNNKYGLVDYTIEMFGSEIDIYLPMGEHSGDLYINLVNPQNGGMIELDWQEGNDTEGNRLRQQLLGAYLCALGYQIKNSRFVYNSDTGAATIKDLLDTFRKTLEMILPTRDFDLTLENTAIPARDYLNNYRLLWQLGMETFRDMFYDANIDERKESLDRLNGPLKNILNKFLENLGIETIPEGALFGQETINVYVNNQIEKALKREQLVYDTEYTLARNKNYSERSQVKTFAELLHDPDETDNLIINANIFHDILKISPERIKIIGAINGYPVHRLVLDYPGETLTFWALIHNSGQILAAYCAKGDCVYETKDPETGNIYNNCITAPLEILNMLSRQQINLLKAKYVLSPEELKVKQRLLKQTLAQPQFIPLVNLGAAIRFPGIKVSQGIATGRAVFNSPGKRPEDFHGAVLVSSMTTPKDQTKMQEALAIVTTSGGPLTHAGILCREFGKPGLIIDGHWNIDKETDTSFIAVPYEIFTRIQEKAGGYTIVRRININHKLTSIHEGDILTIDGTGGTLYNWGQSESILNTWALTRKIIEEKDWESWDNLLQIVENTDDRMVVRFLIQEIFTGNLCNILELDEKEAFLAALLKNKNVSNEGREFLNRMADAMEKELFTLIREYSVKIRKSIYPRQIWLLDTKIKERKKALSAFYKILGKTTPTTLNAAYREFQNFVYNRYDTLAEKIQEELKGYIKSLDSLNDQRMRRLRNLFKQARFLKRRRRKIMIPKLKQIRGAIAAWERNKHKVSETNKRKTVLPLSLIDIYCKSFVGAKAAALGELAKIIGRKHIPDGFSVTDHTFQRFMEHNDIWRKISSIMDLSDIDSKEKYIQIQRVFQDASWPQDLKNEILRQYRKLEKQLSATEKERIINEIIKNAPIGLTERGRDILNGIVSQYRENNPKKWKRLTITKLIEQIETIPDDIKRQMVVFFRQTSGPFVAVRSSAVGSEDSPEASFAGEMETYLYCRGEEIVLKHIKQCMASLWTPRAISYRKWHGYKQSELHHSVFIQLMVDAMDSAVGFSIDPVSQDWDQIVLNTGPGVGEGIMGHGINTDLIFIDKNLPDNRFELGLVAIIRQKSEMFVYDYESGYGIAPIEVDPKRATSPALSVEELKICRRLITRIERYWGTPRDIELAVSRDRKIMVVQDRPVTALITAKNPRKKPIIYEKIPIEEAMPILVSIEGKIQRALTAGSTIADLNEQETTLINLILTRNFEIRTIKESRQLHDMAIRLKSIIATSNELKARLPFYHGSLEESI